MTKEQDGNEHDFKELYKRFIYSRLPKLASRTASKWTAFDKSAEGKKYEQQRSEVVELFYSRVCNACAAFDIEMQQILRDMDNEENTSAPLESQK